MAMYSHVDIGPASPIPHGVPAATRVQKMYRSYRTRRRLADSAVIAEELWWQALEFVRLNRSTVSFFDYAKPESAISRWNRVGLNASKVGQGLSKDFKALKLASQHWIEAIDPRHRYGHNLHIYYEKWCESTEGQIFFYWLDLGEGKNVDLPECPRSLLRKQCVKYMGPTEREHFEYIVSEGKIVHKQTGGLLDTGTDGSKGSKWIFVMSTCNKLYAGKKKKGMFHHSSFLSGGATIAAGRFTVENGILKSVWAYSGHYKPSAENLSNFLTFLRENGVDLDKVEKKMEANKYMEDETTASNFIDDKWSFKSKWAELSKFLYQVVLMFNIVIRAIVQVSLALHPFLLSNPEPRASYRRTLSGGLQIQKAEVPQNEILKRIKSKEKSRSYQLGHQISLKWSTGAGPRIGCVKDYPMELRKQALEIVNLSHKGRYGNHTPTSPLTPHGTTEYMSSCLSPTTNGGVE